jgi:O-antigen biosynthesis protein WbqP
LPQIWNVLLGDMSFVGPRPCLPNQHELIGERSARNVFATRPGITGLAQVQGVDMSTPRQLAEIDARYASERTFMGDLKLLAQTFVGSGRGDAARKL